ncbi:bifunctional protein GlmU-like isoform X2 [Melanotaenia boesemani]|nr:bifunctional protein GlmU-like isoform X2 [Melanotaenia boesemani]
MATNTNQVMHLSGRFEIVSLVGTLNQDAHLHISLSDLEGRTIGGHVLGGLEVFTTAEVVIGEAVDLHFSREMDERTGFPELVVQTRSNSDK